MFLCLIGIVSATDLTSSAVSLADYELSTTFYLLKCPLGLFTINNLVTTAVRNESRMGASLLRLHFHDCFVQGCDASVLLKNTATFTGEQGAFPNANSLRGFEVIDNIKAKLEILCPGVFSCADILAVAARDSVVALGGLGWQVRLGRRDSTTASLSGANSDLPAPFLGLNDLVAAFQKKGFTVNEMVALSGAHTIGSARCLTFRSRAYNDSDIEPSYANFLRSNCPKSGGDDNLSPIDIATKDIFDNAYYRNLLYKKGLFHSDQQLYSGGFTDSKVKYYATYPSLFFKSDFANAMLKMSNLSPLTGTQASADSANELRPDFYNSQCSQALQVIKKEVTAAGCDASVLLKDTANFTGEQSVIPDVDSTNGTDIILIEKIKARLEKLCPDLGGPTWNVLLGRRDSTTANLSAVLTDFPTTFMNLTELLATFGKKNFTAQEMVAFTGAHTTGRIKCLFFRTRIYNESNINPSYARSLQAKCPFAGGDDNLAPLDRTTPILFDNAYYKNLLKQNGLLHSDQQLYNNGSTDTIVEFYAKNPLGFRTDFAKVMTKMGNLSPLTGTNGQIRKQCSKSQCPQALEAIKAEITSAVRKEPAMGLAFFRLHFIDSVGCDPSNLLKDTANFTGEQSAIPSLDSRNGTDIIEKIKARVEKLCPGAVSCADIVAFAARDSVVAKSVHMGRRDSTTANLSVVTTNLRSAYMALDEYLAVFGKMNFTTKETVAFVGVHTIDYIKCLFVLTRIYNESNIDPSLFTLEFGKQPLSIASKCPLEGGDDNIAPLDITTPNHFDNAYYKHLLKKKGLQHTDQKLYNGGSTDSIVEFYATNPLQFRRYFVKAVIKMGNFNPLTSTNGQIRKQCSKELYILIFEFTFFFSFMSKITKNAIIFVTVENPSLPRQSFLPHTTTMLTLELPIPVPPTLPLASKAFLNWKKYKLYFKFMINNIYCHIRTSKQLLIMISLYQEYSKRKTLLKELYHESYMFYSPFESIEFKRRKFQMFWRKIDAKMDLGERINKLGSSSWGIKTKYDLSKKLKETMANFQYSTTNTPKVYEEQVTASTDSANDLRPDFYKSQCPQALEAIKAEITFAVRKEPAMGLAFFRLHFIDCFVQAISLIVLLITQETQTNNFKLNCKLYFFFKNPMGHQKHICVVYLFELYTKNIPRGRYGREKRVQEEGGKRVNSLKYWGENNKSQFIFMQFCFPILRMIVKRTKKSERRGKNCLWEFIIRTCESVLKRGKLTCKTERKTWFGGKGWPRGSETRAKQMDRSWMNESRISPEYEEGVEQFLQFASQRGQPNEDEKYYCPCINCLNGRRQILDDIREHLLCDGIKRKLYDVDMAWVTQTGQMMYEAAKEIADRIDSLDEQASQGSFVPHGRQDILTAAIGRPEHPGRVRAVGAADPTNQRPTGGVNHRKSDLKDGGILQPDAVPGLALPPEPEVGPSGPRVNTKESCVAHSGNDPGTGDSDKCGLYIKENSSRLVALGRLYVGSTTVYNIPLLHGQVKVGVEEIKDAEALVPVPTDEVTLVGQALNTFLAWPTHLVKRLSEQAAVSPAKPPESPDEEVDDPLYLMTLTIPQLFLKPLQVMWDATIFGVFNQNFPLYIKHEDLSEIAHGGQCLSISVIQLWILHLTETSVRAGNSDMYGFLEPQSIQRSGQSQFESESYIKSWIQSSKRDVYLGAYLNGPDNYLKGIINSVLKGLDDTPQPKSKADVRWIVVKRHYLKKIPENNIGFLLKKKTDFNCQ
ncbi:Cationic peroxidase 1 [Glycine soja]